MYPEAHSLVALCFFSFSSKNDGSIMDLKKKKEMKGILSYFPVELLKMHAEKRHNAYKTQVLCIPTNKKS